MTLCVFAGVLLAGPALWKRLRSEDPLRGAAILLGGGLAVVTAVFCATTRNQALNGVGYVFLTAGLLHAGLWYRRSWRTPAAGCCAWSASC